jgi:hypothetical protein
MGKRKFVVAKHIGNAVLVYCDYPAAHEEDAEQAVLAGLDLCAAVKRLKSGADVTLRCRVGIASSLVIIGDLVGVGERQERGIVGVAPIMATRLQAWAQPDTVATQDVGDPRMARRALVLRVARNRLPQAEAAGPGQADSRSSFTEIPARALDDRAAYAVPYGHIAAAQLSLQTGDLDSALDAANRALMSAREARAPLEEGAAHRARIRGYGHSRRGRGCVSQ